MALPPGTEPVLGGFVSTLAALPDITSPALRDAKVIVPFDGKWWRVKDDNTGWEQVGGDQSAGGVDQTARDEAASAKRSAQANAAAIAAVRGEATSAKKSATTNAAAIATIAKEAIGRIDVHPGRIRDAADLDGTYQCIVSLTDAEVTRLNGAGVNYLEIWFGTETVHVVSPWAPALATRIDAVVDQSEETQIGAGVNVYPVRAVYRINQGGGQDYYAEGAGALRVAGFNAPDEGDTWNTVSADDAGGLNSEFVAHRLTNSALLVLITGDFTTRTRSYKTGQRWYLAPHQSSELFMALVSEAPSKTFTLTQAQQIALLSLVADPGSISFKGTADLAAKVKTLRINIQNPELLTGDAWVEGWTQGQPGMGARTKWTNTVAGFNIVLADASAAAVASAMITDNEEQVEVRMRFYDAESAGNEIERIGINVPLINLGITEVDNSREADFQGLKLWYGTKAQFDAIVTKDASTIYYYPPA